MGSLSRFDVALITQLVVVGDACSMIPRPQAAESWALACEPARIPAGASRSPLPSAFSSASCRVS